MPHPTILTFGETVQRTFPLLLVIGREPNRPLGEEVENTVKHFPLNHDPKCCFWNRSHAQLARIGGNTTAQEFRKLCQISKASPIIYAGSLGICIPNGCRDKDERRWKWVNDPENVIFHIGNIFSHPIIKRVQLAILSGLQAEVFGPVVASMTERFQKSSVLCQPVRFFGSRLSNHNLDADLSPESIRLLHQIYEQFRLSLSDQVR